MKIYNGKYIIIDSMSQYYHHVALMILEHYDTEVYQNTVFLLGTYITNTYEEIRAKYPSNRLIVYQLEQFISSNHLLPFDRMLDNLKKVDEVWEYDLSNIVYFNSQGIASKFRPMRYTTKLENQIPDLPKKYDILLYGTMNELRSKWLIKLTNNTWDNIRIAYVFNSFDDNLNQLIGESKCVLNVHQFSYNGLQEQVRLFYLLINNVPILSEKSDYNYFSNLLLECQYNNLRDTFHTKVLGTEELSRLQNESSITFKYWTYNDSNYLNYINYHINKYNLLNNTNIAVENSLL